MQTQKMGSLYKLYCWGWKNGALECFPALLNGAMKRSLSGWKVHSDLLEIISSFSNACFPLFQHWLLSIFLYYRQGFAEGAEWKRSQVKGSEWTQNQTEC
jgi:hypothetical protein